MTEIDTITAAATPPGESALAVIRVSGPLAGGIAASMHENRPPPPRRAWHGRYSSLDGRLVDEAVFVHFPGPASYTGDDVLEISCHGNPFIVHRILEDLNARGCRLAEPGEFTKRAFLAGKMDLTRAEAVIDVIRARSDRALAAAERQLQGELGSRIHNLMDHLLRIAASVEAYIDFPEEDLPPEDRHATLTEAGEILQQLQALVQSRRQSTILREGAAVVILGAPNAGKSSLLNRIVGYERAIVSETPGTTRDYLEEEVLLGPHRIRVIDTAGLRPAEEQMEIAGVERAIQQIREADIHLLVVDVTRPLPEIPGEVLARLSPESALVVLNKIDLPSRHPPVTRLSSFPVIEVSAATGQGLDRLRLVLIEILDRLTGTGVWDEGIGVNLRHAEALGESAKCLCQAINQLEKAMPLELAASDFRGAVHQLERVVGRIDNEALLDRLFATFCIGK